VNEICFYVAELDTNIIFYKKELDTNIIFYNNKELKKHYFLLNIAVVKKIDDVF